MKNILLKRINVMEENLHDYTYIHSDRQFDEFVSKLMKKNSMKIFSISVTYNMVKKKFISDITAESITNSRTQFDPHTTNAFVRNGNKLKIVKNFSREYISINLDDEAARRIGDIAFDSTLVIATNSKGWAEAYIEIQNALGISYFDLANSVYVNELPVNAEIRKYKFVPATASAKRNKSGIFEDITSMDTRFDNFNKATLGALDVIKNNVAKAMAEVNTPYDVKEVTKNLQKQIGYVGNASTGSINTGAVKGFYRYKDKWLNRTDEYFLTDDYLKATESLIAGLAKHDEKVVKEAMANMEAIKNSKAKLEKQSTQDGQMYVNGLELAVMLFEKFHVIINPKVLIGRMLQLRPGTIKASAVIVSPKVFNAIVEGSRLLAKEYNTSVEPVGDVDHALFIADKNCVKLEFKFPELMTMELLAFNKCSQSDASKQMYKNIMYAAQKQGKYDKIIALMEEVQELTLDTKLSSSIDANAPSRLVTTDEVINAIDTGYFTNVMSGIGAGFMKESKVFMESAWKQTINSLVDDIDRMHDNLKVESRRLSSDPTFIITGGNINGILKLGQSFINSRKVGKNIMFKYPVAGLEEQYANENVSIKQIKKTIYNLLKSKKITKTMADGVVDFYGSLKPSVMVLPGIMYTAMACAGLDFDYDGAVSLIYTKRIDEKRERLEIALSEATDNRTKREIELKLVNIRFEEITNEFIDVLYNNGIRGVSIQI